MAKKTTKSSDSGNGSTIDLAPLDSSSRLLIETKLAVARGTGGRFQPTGFPDLGPALYRGIVTSRKRNNDLPRADTDADTSIDMLLVESVQSMANRLEEVCLAGDGYNADCTGIPYVRVQDGLRNNTFLTSSVREPHRLASPYVLGAQYNGNDYRENLSTALQATKARPVHIWEMVPTIFDRDPGCVLHGVFLEEIDGRIRLPRLVSGHIEAAAPNLVNYGGVYRGEVTAKDNIPYPRQEFTSPTIAASFVFHCATLNGYNLDEPKRRFLQAWALYKIDRFLNAHLRLRTACEFDVDPNSIEVYLDGVRHPLSQDGDWPSTAIKNSFTNAKDACFPPLNGDDEWNKKRVVLVTYSPEIIGEVAIEDDDTEQKLNLSEFEGQAQVKKVTRRKRTVKVLQLTGDWSDSNKRQRLLDQNPEQRDGDENPAFALVNQAIADWQSKREKELSKLNAVDDTESDVEGDDE